MNESPYRVTGKDMPTASRIDRELLHDQHRRINHRLCTALDMTKLGTVLDEMEGRGIVSAPEQRALHAAAASLLAIMQQANDRAHDRPPSSPIL